MARRKTRKQLKEESRKATDQTQQYAGGSKQISGTMDEERTFEEIERNRRYVTANLGLPEDFDPELAPVEWIVMLAHRDCCWKNAYSKAKIRVLQALDAQKENDAEMFIALTLGHAYVVSWLVLLNTTEIAVVEEPGYQIFLRNFLEGKTPREPCCVEQFQYGFKLPRFDLRIPPGVNDRLGANEWKWYDQVLANIATIQSNPKLNLYTAQSFQNIPQSAGFLVGSTIPINNLGWAIQESPEAKESRTTLCKSFDFRDPKLTGDIKHISDVRSSIAIDHINNTVGTRTSATHRKQEEPIKPSTTRQANDVVRKKHTAAPKSLEKASIITRNPRNETRGEGVDSQDRSKDDTKDFNTSDLFEDPEEPQLHYQQWYTWYTKQCEKIVHPYLDGYKGHRYYKEIIARLKETYDNPAVRNYNVEPQDTTEQGTSQDQTDSVEHRATAKKQSEPDIWSEYIMPPKHKTRKQLKAEAAKNNSSTKGGEESKGSSTQSASAVNTGSTNGYSSTYIPVNRGGYRIHEIPFADVNDAITQLQNPASAADIGNDITAPLSQAGPSTKNNFVASRSPGVKLDKRILEKMDEDLFHSQAPTHNRTPDGRKIRTLEPFLPKGIQKDPTFAAPVEDAEYASSDVNSIATTRHSIPDPNEVYTKKPYKEWSSAPGFPMIDMFRWPITCDEPQTRRDCESHPADDRTIFNFDADDLLEFTLPKLNVEQPYTKPGTIPSAPLGVMSYGKVVGAPINILNGAHYPTSIRKGGWKEEIDPSGNLDPVVNGHIQPDILAGANVFNSQLKKLSTNIQTMVQAAPSSREKAEIDHGLLSKVQDLQIVANAHTMKLVDTEHSQAEWAKDYEAGLMATLATHEAASVSVPADRVARAKLIEDLASKAAVRLLSNEEKDEIKDIWRWWLGQLKKTHDNNWIRDYLATRATPFSIEKIADLLSEATQEGLIDAYYEEKEAAEATKTTVKVKDARSVPQIVVTGPEATAQVEEEIKVVVESENAAESGSVDTAAEENNEE